MMKPIGIAILLVLAVFYVHAEMSTQASAAAGNGTGSTPATARTVDMRVLIVSKTGDPLTDVTVQLARQTLAALNIPYDEYVMDSVAQPNLTANISNAKRGPIAGILQTGPSTGHYQAIICTRYLFVSAYPDVFSALALYSQQFHARIVYLVSSSNPTGGLVDDMTVPRDDSNTTIVLDPVAASISTAFNGLNRNVTINMTGAFRYPQMVTDPTRVQPVLRFINISNGAAQGVAAATIDYKNGQQELHFYFEQSYWMVPSQVLAHFWAQWATRGLYTGYRRLSVNPVMDDLFLTTQLWNPALPGVQSLNYTYRATAADFDNIVNFTTSLNTALNSSIKLGFAFNGLGAGNPGGIANDAMYQKVRTLLDKFYFDSHGWAHINLTGNGNVSTSYADAMSEINANLIFAQTEMFAGTFNNQSALNYFMNTSYTTASITGLTNPNALRALADVGVRYVTGDNSYPMFQPTLYQCARTTAQFPGNASMVIVPRFGNSVPFDASIPAELESEQHIKFLKNGTYSDFLAIDTAYALGQLLSLKHDQYMFHQANLRQFNWTDPVNPSQSSPQWNFVALWLRSVTNEVRKYLTLPFVSMSHDQLGAECEARTQRATCNAAATLQLDANYNVLAIAVAGGSNSSLCELPLTAELAATNFVNVNGTQYRSELYGPDSTIYAKVSGTATTVIALTTPLAFA